MEPSLDQKSVRELIDSSAINAVKLISSNQSKKETFFFKVVEVPKRLKLYDVMVTLHKQYKLNFITSINKCSTNNNIRNLIVACRNSVEFNNFIRRFDAILVKGYHLKIAESNRPLAINLVKVPEELRH